MNTRSLAGAALGILALGAGIGGGTLLFGGVDTRPVRHLADGARRSAPGDAPAGEVGAGTEAAPGRVARPAPPRPPAPSAQEVAAARDGVVRTLAELRALYGYAGVLDTEAARALIAKRNAETDGLVARLAAYGAAGVAPTVAAYADAQTGREKLTLIRALGDNPSADAAEGLRGLLGEEPAFSYRRAMVEALGESTAPGADALLAEISGDAEDARVRTAAIKALAPGPEADAALSARATDDPDVDVRIAALTRLSEIGGAPAEEVLTRVASQPDAGSRVRAAAIVGLARAFPERAVGALERLASDDQAAVRAAVVGALERIRGEAAAALLRDIAARDAEPSVRAQAEEALARMTL